jgi:hypothetical protein
MQESSPQQAFTSAQTTPTVQPAYMAASHLLAFGLALPLVIGIGALGYKKFRVHRLRRQVEKLERIWNLTHRR